MKVFVSQHMDGDQEIIFRSPFSPLPRGLVISPLHPLSHHNVSQRAQSSHVHLESLKLQERLWECD